MTSFVVKTRFLLLITCILFWKVIKLPVNENFNIFTTSFIIIWGYLQIQNEIVSQKTKVTIIIWGYLQIQNEMVPQKTKVTFRFSTCCNIYKFLLHCCQIREPHPKCLNHFNLTLKPPIICLWLRLLLIALCR